MKKAVIFAGGRLPCNINYDKLINKSDIIICADSGFDNAVSAGFFADYVIGDMDSVRSEIPKGVNTTVLPCEKDDTDSQACLDKVHSLGITEAVMIGALGGRADHSLANIMLTIYAYKIGINLTIIDENTEISLVADKKKFSGKAGDTLSLIPAFKDAKGVTLSGLKYPLENAEIKIGFSLGISNEFIDNNVSVEIKDGLLIAIKISK